METKIISLCAMCGMNPIQAKQINDKITALQAEVERLTNLDKLQKEYLEFLEKNNLSHAGKITELHSDLKQYKSGFKNEQHKFGMEFLKNEKLEKENSELKDKLFLQAESLQLKTIQSQAAIIEKLEEYVKVISMQGWWSTKMTTEQYSNLLDEHKKDADETLAEVAKLKGEG